MTKRTKGILIIFSLIVVAGLYIYVYRDAFRKKTIYIEYTFRSQTARRGRQANGQPAPPRGPIVPEFSFAGVEYKLTSVKVVLAEELKTNKYPHALWSLETQSNSSPVRLFYYGVTIRGMHPTVPGVPAEPLTTNVTYRLLVESEKLKGFKDFTIVEPAAPH